MLQTGGLLPFLTVHDNVMVQRRLLGMAEDGGVGRLLERLGIARHAHRHPSKLSVGERQRVAIARALAHHPAVVIADEPTASLDPVKAEEIMALFAELVAEQGVTLVMATHDHDLAARFGFRPVTFALAADAEGGVTATVAEGSVAAGVEG